MKKISSVFMLLIISIFHLSAQWVNQTNFPTNDNRYFSHVFELNNKVYTGGGFEYPQVLHNDNFEYNPVSNAWTTKSNTPFQARMGAFSFSIGGYGYVGSGSTNGGAAVLNDVWRYNSGTDTWTQMADFPGFGRIGAVTEVVNGKAYVIGGVRSAGLLSDCWEYNSVMNLWTQKADAPAGFKPGYISGFTDGINIYCGLGGINSPTCTGIVNDFWMFNPVTNTWTQKADLPGNKRTYTVGGWLPNVNKGFVGLGGCSSARETDLWTYDIQSNTWTLESSATFPLAISNAKSVILNNEAYIGWGTLSQGGDKRIYKYPNAAATAGITLSAPQQVFCSTGNDTLLYSVSASGIPANTNVVIYQNTDSTFNPYQGQGDSIGFIPGNSIPVDTINFGSCVKIVGILIDACGVSGTEPQNEYIILTSGGGVKVSNLAIDYSSQNNAGASNADINTGANPCGYKTPNAALIASLRAGSCNASNVIPASPSDSIPPNAIILVFTSDSVTAAYNINGLCNLGHKIYVLQSSCTRSIGAFTNASNCTATRYRTTTATDKRQNCSNNFTYDLCNIFNKDGTFAIRQQGIDTASVTNNGIRRNLIDSCGGLDYSQLNFNTDTILKFRIPLNFCNTGFHYIKAITHPNGTQPISNTIKYKLVCNDVTAVSNTTNICSGDSVKINISSTDPNATFSWTVSGGAAITGAAAGSGNIVRQKLINTSAVLDSVKYNILSTDNGCNATTQVTVKVNPSVVPVISGALKICNGGSVRLSVQGQFDSMRWSTNSTSSFIDVTQAGTYSVTAYKNGCSGTASVNVTSTNVNITITGGNQLCEGSTDTLRIAGQYDSIRWNTGASGNQVITSTQGVYSATAYIGTCSASAVVEIGICNVETCNPTITGNIPFCIGDSIVLDAGEGFGQYTWSTGETSQTIVVKSQGKYVVSVEGESCTGSDSVNVIVNPLPQVNITGTTSICIEGSTELTVSAVNIDSLRWNTNETTSSITVSQVGNYSVTVYKRGCAGSAVTQVSLANPPAPFDLGNDTAFCGSFTKILSTGNQTTQWSTGATAAQITVTQAGTYTATITNSCGSAVDEITISQHDLPVVNIGNDTAFCEGQIELKVPGNFQSFVWSTGSHDSVIVVSLEGVYSLSVTDNNGCTNSASINITSNCVNDIWMANAFSPNGDGINDVFLVRGNPRNTTIEKFTIYNRVGNKVFESDNVLPGDIASGWDGKYKGEPAQMEIYGYYVIAKFSNGEEKVMKGNVTLLR